MTGPWPDQGAAWSDASAPPDVRSVADAAVELQGRVQAVEQRATGIARQHLTTITALLATTTVTVVWDTPLEGPYAVKVSAPGLAASQWTVPAQNVAGCTVRITVALALGTPVLISARPT